MTGNRKDTTITRRRALVVTSGGGLAGGGHRGALWTLGLLVAAATELLHTAGPLGLRHVQAGARGVLDAGGTATPAGRAALSDLGTDLHARAWSPRGSAGLLEGALFVNSLPVPALTRAA